MITTIGDLQNLKELLSKERKIFLELSPLQKYLERAEAGEKKIIASQMALIKQELRRTNEQIPFALNKINLVKSLNPKKEEATNEGKDQKIKKEGIQAKKPSNFKAGQKITGKVFTEKAYSLKDLKPTRLEKLTLKRMKKQEKKTKTKKEPKPNQYTRMANRFFSDISEKLVNEKKFKELERDLIKANLQFTPRGYISVIFFTTCIAFIAGILVGLFFFFFNITSTLPIITKTTAEMSSRLLKLVLITILSPLLTFLIMYNYPSLEKSSTGTRIEEELPFATIHMSAISGSMIDPSKIFDIIISTHEYPFLEKEFKKLINEINLYGYDLVNALRNSAYNTPSKKLSELFNGLATTINSGGYLPEFFDKRSQTLLFENRLEQEKKTKAAETFMDIYISMVVAAPMILMILLMMMKISGLGVAMSTSMITIIMVVAVTMINIVFLVFLQLKR